jgi:hypothetical protein
VVTNALILAAAVSFQLVYWHNRRRTGGRSNLGTMGRCSDERPRQSMPRRANVAGIEFKLDHGWNSARSARRGRG